MYVELSDEVETADAGFPMWLIIVLILASLSVIVISMIMILTLHRRLTSAATAAVKGSAFVRMESGNASWSLPRPDRRVWTSSHLQHSLPPVPHTVVNVPMVSLVDERQKVTGVED